MTGFLHDIRLSLRTLRRKPAFTIVVLITLALAIGGNTAIFSVANSVYFRALPFADAERVFRLRISARTPDGRPTEFSMMGNIFADMVPAVKSAPFVAMNAVNQALISGDTPQRVSVVSVSSGWMDVFGVRPVVGRYFTPQEEEQGAASGAAIISDGLWRQRFGGDPGVIGKALRFEDRTLTIVGVFPRGFRFPYEGDIWTPIRLTSADTTRDYAVFARLNPGVTQAQFTGEVDAFARQFPQRYAMPAGHGVAITGSRQSLIGDDHRTVVALLAVVAFLLLIACVDIASLLLARSVARRQEFALRTALGATGWRHFRHLLAETFTLSLMGWAAGVVLAAWLGRFLDGLVPRVFRDQFAFQGFALDYRVLAYSLAITGFAAMCCGLVPLLTLRSTFLHDSLKLGGRVVGEGHRRRVLDIFVVGQVAFSLVLLTGAALMIQNFRRLNTRPLGVDGPRTLSMAFSVPENRYATAESRASLIHRIDAAVAEVPGVSSAGLTTVNPFALGTWGANVIFEGRPEDEVSLINHRLVTPRVFTAMGIPIRRGRTFTEQDRAGSELVVIVSEALARRFWPGQDAIGKRMRATSRLLGRDWRTVVGVVGDVQDSGEYRETWYLPYAQAGNGPSSEEVNLMVRSDADPVELTKSVEQAVWSVDRTLPLYDISRLDRVYSNVLARERMGAMAASLFSGFALLLASLGTFGVISYTVYQRTHELGVRMALGATREDILKLVLRSGVSLAAIGVAVGAAGAVALNRMLASLLPMVGRTELTIYAVVAGVLAVVSLVACWLPARRASLVDPMEALRYE